MDAYKIISLGQDSIIEFTIDDIVVEQTIANLPINNAVELAKSLTNYLIDYKTGSETEKQRIHRESAKMIGRVIEIDILVIKQEREKEEKNAKILEPKIVEE